MPPKYPIPLYTYMCIYIHTLHFVLATPHRNTSLSLSLSHTHTHTLSLSSLSNQDMKSLKGKNMVKVCINKWRKNIGSSSSSSSKMSPCTGCEYCCQYWSLWPFVADQENNSIPKDVPKGHLVVYVGKEQKRFVIKISLLNHPLFKALLDEARDEYDFTPADSKLCIPCDDSLFLDVVRCATCPDDRRSKISTLCL